jgi:hypothetical protein
MQQIDWNILGLKGESRQKSFEDICMFLCCRELKISKINSYQNQPGIETEPFEVNGKKYHDTYYCAMICFTCGLRWGEAKALTKENIRSGKVFIFNTKSGKNRFVPIRDD